MARRFYTAVAPLVTLSSGVTNSSVTLAVASTAGYPASVPFTIALERGTINEEVCLCTAKGGTTFTVTRGWDGTTAVAHSTGAAIEHVSSAVDYDDANAHIFDVARNDHTQYPTKTLWTAKGMIVLASAPNTPLGLAVGADNTVMMADATQTTGAKWSTIGTVSITDGAISLVKLSASVQQQVIQSVADHTALTAVVGQTAYNTTTGRWYGYAVGGWFLKPHGIGKVTASTGDPSGGIDGDVHLKYV